MQAAHSSESLQCFVTSAMKQEYTSTGGCIQRMHWDFCRLLSCCRRTWGIWMLFAVKPCLNLQSLLSLTHELAPIPMLTWSNKLHSPYFKLVIPSNSPPPTTTFWFTASVRLHLLHLFAGTGLDKAAFSRFNPTGSQQQFRVSLLFRAASHQNFTHAAGTPCPQRGRRQGQWWCCGCRKNA